LLSPVVVVPVKVKQFVLAAIKQTNTMARRKETAINTVFSTSNGRTQFSHKVTQLFHGGESSRRREKQEKMDGGILADDLAILRLFREIFRYRIPLTLNIQILLGLVVPVQTSRVVGRRLKKAPRNVSPFEESVHLDCTAHNKHRVCVCGAHNHGVAQWYR
jgi:hypothetical protein